MSDVERASPVTMVTTKEKSKARLSMMSISQVDLLVRKDGAKRKCATWKVAAVAVAVVVLVGVVVATTLLMTSKQRKLDVPATFAASFTATSRYDSSIVWSGKIHKTSGEDGKWNVQGQVWSTRDGVRTVVTVLDGRAYLQVFNKSVSSTMPTSASCYDPNAMLPFGDLNTVFNNAAEITGDTAPGAAAAPGCAGRVTYALHWGIASGGRNTYTLCSMDASTHQLAGSEFVADVFDFTTTPGAFGAAVPTNVTTGQPLSCPLLPRDVTALGQGRRLSSAYSPGYELGVHGPSKGKSSNLIAVSRKCVFVEGYAARSGYWGDIENRLAEGCTSFTYVRPQFEWDAQANADAFCNAAGNLYSSLTDVVVYSHGIGGLVVANALDTNRCSAGSEFYWFSSQTPWGYTPLADAMKSGDLECHDLPTPLEALGLCSSGNDNRRQLSLTNGYRSGAKMARLVNIAATASKAQHCGTTASGLLMGDGVHLPELAADVLAFWQNDGLVVSEACGFGTTTSFYSDSASLMYASSLNHLDGSCRYGDAFIDPFLSYSPCEWMYNALAWSASLTQ